MPNTCCPAVKSLFSFFRVLNLGISWPWRKWLVWWISCWTSWQFENPSAMPPTLVERFPLNCTPHTHNVWLQFQLWISLVGCIPSFYLDNLYFHRCWVTLELYFCSIRSGISRDGWEHFDPQLRKRTLLGPFQYLRGNTPAWSGHGRQGRSTLYSLATLKQHELFWGVLVVMEMAKEIWG